MDTTMHKQFICSSCHSKNSVSYERSRVYHLASEIERMVRNATDEEKEEQRKILNQNSYLKSMCEYNEHCRYGIHCNQLNNDISSINNNNRKLSENIVLLGVMDKNKLKYYLPSFQGYYPKAARYILSL